jgi:hypothetical protein
VAGLAEAVAARGRGGASQGWPRLLVAVAAETTFRRRILASAEASIGLETSRARGGSGRMNSTELEELQGGRAVAALRGSARGAGAVLGELDLAAALV